MTKLRITQCSRCPNDCPMPDTIEIDPLCESCKRELASLPRCAVCERPTLPDDFAEDTDGVCNACQADAEDEFGDETEL